jgi:hypothetical protein
MFSKFLSPQMSQRYVRACRPKVTESKKKKSMDTATVVEKKSRQQLTTWPSLSRGVTVLSGAAQLSHQFLPLAAQHTGRQAARSPPWLVAAWGCQPTIQASVTSAALHPLTQQGIESNKKIIITPSESPSRDSSFYLHTEGWCLAMEEPKKEYTIQASAMSRKFWRIFQQRLEPFLCIKTS